MLVAEKHPQISSPLNQFREAISWRVRPVDSSNLFDVGGHHDFAPICGGFWKLSVACPILVLRPTFSRSSRPQAPHIESPSAATRQWPRRRRCHRARQQTGSKLQQKNAGDPTTCKTRNLPGSAGYWTRRWWARNRQRAGRWPNRAERRPHKNCREWCALWSRMEAVLADQLTGRIRWCGRQSCADKPRAKGRVVRTWRAVCAVRNHAPKHGMPVWTRIDTINSHQSHSESRRRGRYDWRACVMARRRQPRPQAEPGFGRQDARLQCVGIGPIRNLCWCGWNRKLRHCNHNTSTARSVKRVNAQQSQWHGRFCRCTASNFAKSSRERWIPKLLESRAETWFGVRARNLSAKKVSMDSESRSSVASLRKASATASANRNKIFEPSTKKQSRSGSRDCGGIGWNKSANQPAKSSWKALSDTLPLNDACSLEHFERNNVPNVSTKTANVAGVVGTYHKSVKERWRIAWAKLKSSAGDRLALQQP